MTQRERLRQLIDTLPDHETLMDENVLLRTALQKITSAILSAEHISPSTLLAARLRDERHLDDLTESSVFEALVDAQKVLRQVGAQEGRDD